MENGRIDGGFVRRSLRLTTAVFADGHRLAMETDMSGIQSAHISPKDQCQPRGGQLQAGFGAVLTQKPLSGSLRLAPGAADDVQ